MLTCHLCMLPSLRMRGNLLSLPCSSARRHAKYLCLYDRTVSATKEHRQSYVQNHKESVWKQEWEMFSERFLCHFAFLVGLYVHLLRIPTFCTRSSVYAAVDTAVGQ
jgi:hypothetical protein